MIDRKATHQCPSPITRDGSSCTVAMEVEIRGGGHNTRREDGPKERSRVCRTNPGENIVHDVELDRSSQRWGNIVVACISWRQNIRTQTQSRVKIG